MDALVTIRLPALAATRGSASRGEASSQPALTPAEPCDESLMAHIGQGDREALALLFSRYARLIRGVAYRILRDPFEADDLLQEVFLYIHRKAERFDSAKSSARTWIVQLTYHRAIDRHRYLTSRHFYNRVDIEDVIGQEGDPAVEDPLGAIADAAGVEMLLGSLSENQRRTLSLFFVEGCTFEEIAVKLGQTRGNIKNHYFRGLEKLRKLVQGNPKRHSAV